MTLRNEEARKQISEPARPHFGSNHVGTKSKEVLLQELKSLENTSTKGLDKTEKQQLVNAKRDLFKEIIAHPEYTWIFMHAKVWQDKLHQIKRDWN